MKNFEEIPEDLKAAAQTNLVLFVGAGVSRLAGGVSWDQFAENYISYLRKKEVISFAQKEQLLSLSTKEKLSMARHLEKEKAKPSSDEFREMLVSGNASDAAKGFLKNIVSMEVPIVTTNYDDFLERAAKDYYTDAYPDGGRGPHSIVNINDIKDADLARSNSIIHLHGSIEEPNKAVVSDIDYIRHYSDQHIIDFLQCLFRNHTILFMGYGLAEAEVLAHLFNLDDGGRYKDNKRFWFKDYFRYYGDLQDLQISYFKAVYGIEILPYYRDYRNFDELFDVFEELNQSSTSDKTRFAPTVQLFREAFND